MKKISQAIFNARAICFLAVVSLSPLSTKGQKVFFTTGFKFTELTQKSVTIWTRLCSQENPNPVSHQRRKEIFRHPVDFDENMEIAKMDGAVLPSSGLVRVTLVKGTQKRTSRWKTVHESRDFTAKFVIGNLEPGTHYEVILEGKKNRSSEVTSIKGRFKTPGIKSAVVPVNFTVSTCQYFWSFDDEERGFKAYDSMNRLNPDFFVQTGDYVYYDKPGPLATSIEKARHKWHAMDSWPALRDFYKNIPSYFLKDDHDLLSDDAGPFSNPFGDLTYKNGLDIWKENNPLNGKPYRTFRWGNDLQVWLVEGREFRNDTAESVDGRTIWGNKQKRWFENSFKKSDATFRLLISPTPVIGPDRKGKSDNHSNSTFDFEGMEIKQFLKKQKNAFIINGDRHWQYVSKDLKEGVYEFGCGPISDFHAQGWDEKDIRPEHRFLRVKGGFLGVNVTRTAEIPQITFTHFNVEGNIVHQEKFDGL